jgi:hypothetical protein
MTTPQNNVQSMSPQALAEHLFNTAFMQNPKDAQLIATQVIEYLGRALFHAINSAKYDPVAYMTEALINTVVVTSEDDAARREVLKHISHILGQIATQQPQQQPQPQQPQPQQPQPQPQPQQPQPQQPQPQPQPAAQPRQPQQPWPPTGNSTGKP